MQEAAEQAQQQAAALRQRMEKAEEAATEAARKAGGRETSDDKSTNSKNNSDSEEEMEEEQWTEPPPKKRRQGCPKEDVSIPSEIKDRTGIDSALTIWDIGGNIKAISHQEAQDPVVTSIPLLVRQTLGIQNANDVRNNIDQIWKLSQVLNNKQPHQERPTTNRRDVEQAFDPFGEEHHTQTQLLKRMTEAQYIQVLSFCHSL